MKNTRIFCPQLLTQFLRDSSSESDSWGSDDSSYDRSEGTRGFFLENFWFWLIYDFFHSILEPSESSNSNSEISGGTTGSDESEDIEGVPDDTAIEEDLGEKENFDENSEETWPEKMPGELDVIEPC